MPNATFSAIVPSDRKILCATKPIVFCHERRLRELIIVLSIFNMPCCGSIRPSKISMSVDLPEPEGPTIPTTLLAGIDIFN